MSSGPTIHATSIVLGTRGVLIRGKPGAGKTALALHLLGRLGPSAFSGLVSDDRTAVASQNGRLMARSVESIAGLAEIRGLGIAAARRCAASAVVTLIVDLVPGEEAVRLPEADGNTAEICGVTVRVLRLPDAMTGSLDAKADAILAALGLSPSCRPAPVDG